MLKYDDLMLTKPSPDALQLRVYYFKLQVTG
jgi:hypothetical protein